jgi:hypothetical protein
MAATYTEMPLFTVYCSNAVACAGSQSPVQVVPDAASSQVALARRPTNVQCTVKQELTAKVGRGIVPAVSTHRARGILAAKESANVKDKIATGQLAERVEIAPARQVQTPGPNVIP